MLRIYLYGDCNQVQSSRRLACECGRNLELIWLTGRLQPDFRTIADFRKDNGLAIRKVRQQFVALCRDINLLDGNLVAIAGSRFKAVNADAYICPAGEQLTYRFTGPQDGKAIRVYWSSNCADCVIKYNCTNSKQRRIRRWEHEGVLERVQQRLDKDPTQLAVRSMTVEHPYGTIKSWMGATHFKMRRLKNGATDLALHVCAYNMTRVMKIMGNPALVAALKA